MDWKGNDAEDSLLGDRDPCVVSAMKPRSISKLAFSSKADIRLELSQTKHDLIIY